MQQCRAASMFVQRCKTTHHNLCLAQREPGAHDQMLLCKKAYLKPKLHETWSHKTTRIKMKPERGCAKMQANHTAGTPCAETCARRKVQIQTQIARASSKQTFTHAHLQNSSGSDSRASNTPISFYLFTHLVLRTSPKSCQQRQ